MRKLFFNLHLYTSLTSGLILLVVALSGCLLVFEVPMDRWLNRSASYVEPHGQPLPGDSLVAGVRARHPGKPVTEIDVAGPRTSWIVKIDGARVFVDPYTGSILGERNGQPPSYWLRYIHKQLVAGPVGSQIVFIATWLALLQSMTGLYLWWPLKRVKVKWGASFRRVNFDLHHAVGFFSSIFICILAVTGLLKGYGDSLQPTFDRITGQPAMDRKMLVSSSPQSNPARRISLDQAIAVAEKTMAGASLARIQPPKGASGVYQLSLRFPGDSTAPGRSYVVVDQYNGAVLWSQDARTAPGGAMIPIVNRAIHVGGIYGVPTRILAFLASLAIAAQVFTGFVMWWKRRSLPAKKRKIAEQVLVDA
jgi:uncharacterized iron-regulated membrane protein